ncbi:endonuclease/exonuclease/phosphatase family protein [Mycolicibacterium flavescens]|uniref:endonuclease/exonuclease/phosphatase family protein n=1 Tax=Mycolicibacterium flavescens TaxID=1776 RepID=UPI000A06158C|nr:endonuclease/exonuclease/phosphatase family protein [Mycolicibacterium flavescens]MCV7281688.1 endonuclease/exonuclease/phosphatase family protein [Mycolicibacterium flavescens]
MDITVATWNTAWRTPSSGPGRRIASILEATGADVIVVTEAVSELLPADGYTVDAGPYWGYSQEPARRKVIVWSRHPLTPEHTGEAGATRGRLVAATAAFPHGPVRIVGVCVPWPDAHVRTGRGDAQRWSEHLDYLDRFERWLPTVDDGTPTIIAGDFNQRVPRKRQPIHVATRLAEALTGWTIHTAGALPNGPHIDHIATDHRLVLRWVDDWPSSDQCGRLSDHAGVVCRLSYSGPSTSSTRAKSTSRTPCSEERDVVGTHDDGASCSEKPRRWDGGLTPELRAEIEDILRRSSEGLTHGAVFRLREKGLGLTEIAAERGVSVSSTREFLKSLEALLDGAIPTTKSAALRNSYVYRELLNHPLSTALSRYVGAQLQKLKEVNPEVSSAPLKTRTHQYRVGKRKRPSATITDPCPDCAAVGIIHSGRC